MTTTRIEERAIEQHVRRRTVRLLDMTDNSCGGSGVSIKLGKRFFVATAAHVIPISHDIRILVGEGHDENIGIFTARHSNEEDDVGLLELEAHVAGAINREFTEPAQLMTRIDQSSNWAATVLGYPGQLVETQSTRTGDTLHRVHSFRTLTLITELIPSSAWPSFDAYQRRPTQAACDALVRFDHKSVLFDRNLAKIDQVDSPAEIDEVYLAGMSGCGVWLDSSTSGLWRPEPVLIGILTGATKHWARATLITRWLRLVARSYTGEFENVERQLDADA